MSTYARSRGPDRIRGVTSRGLGISGYFREAGRVITDAVASSDTPCWTLLDPATLLMTGFYNDDGDRVPHEVLVAEYLGDMVMRTSDTLRSPAGILTLAQATNGSPHGSSTYNEYLRPMGIEHIVEVALRTRTGEAWGSVCLTRAPGQPDFDRTELRFLRTIAPLVAEGTRRALLIDATTAPDGSEAPGLLVLDDRMEVVSLGPGVERWLVDLPGHWDTDELLPPAVVAVAARAVRTAEGTEDPGDVAVARVLSRSGRWIVLHGMSLVTDGTLRAAVIVEPAHPARLGPLLMSAYGLTPREQQVTRLVLRGRSTSEIAAAMDISPHTVQQHLKSTFEKTGVHSRRELVGEVFFAHYEPRLRDNEHRTVAGRPWRPDPVPARRSPDPAAHDARLEGHAPRPAPRRVTPR